MGGLFTSKLYGQQNVTPAVCNGLLNPMSLKREWEGFSEKTILLQSLAALLGLVLWGGLNSWVGVWAGLLQYSPSLRLSLVNTKEELLLQTAATQGHPKWPWDCWLYYTPLPVQTSVDFSTAPFSWGSTIVFGYTTVSRDSWNIAHHCKVIVSPLQGSLLFHCR